MQDFFLFIIYSGITLNLLLILLVINRFKKQFSNQILAFILVCLLVLFLTYASSYIQSDTISTLILPFGAIIYMALGPLLLNYVQAIYGKITIQKVIKDLIPFFIGLLTFTLPSYIFKIPTNEQGFNYSTLIYIIPFLGSIYFIYCLYNCYRTLKKYRTTLKKNYSFTKNIDLKWFSIWVNGLIALLIIDMICGGILIAYPSLQLVLFINLLYLTGLIWYMGYYGLNQSQVFLTTQEVEKTETKLYSQSPTLIQSDEFLDLEKKLKELFENRQLFKQQNLTLRETADALEISDKKLSNFINQHLKTSFYDYVNSYRIQNFKESIRKGDSNQLTLLAIAFDSGFNSKATFNRVFKNSEGITPLQYKKSIEKGIIASNESI
ncbi:helix-turn-helix domain-containing protein [Tenacibaculum jejuense]|uniref:Probable transmembrane protein. Putative transcriptional regulator, AraC family n=1 Tax=Tenacibaculum jejuense TaxID=584609 RepID=A0A238U6Y8_9FLAO|nr:helix-turn-helix domain-containing protein [Tenacibaculum jejuense]SNR14943.1 Probable transmembrane protein. Putative transcriptional regulator, AraC family [Tenacibaculum jejuense]